MKNILYVAFALLILASCEKPKKIAFVDSGIVINDLQEKKDIEEKYKAKDEAFKKRADSIGQAFQLEAQTTQEKAQKSSRKKGQEMMLGLQQKQQQLQQQLQYEQQQLGKDFQVEIDSVISTVKTYVKDYGKTSGYTYILGTNDAAATVMYGADEYDLTQTILDSLNTKYEKAK